MRDKKGRLWGWGLIIIGIVYLANFGFGFIEFLPDNLPYVGNIDEGVAGTMVAIGLRKIGWLK